MSHLPSTRSHAPYPNNQVQTSLHWEERIGCSRQDWIPLLPHFWSWPREGAAHLAGEGHKGESLLGTGGNCKMACLSRTL